MSDEYIKARKIGERQVRQAVLKGEYPYLPALDDLIMRLQEYRAALADGSADELMPVLREGRECKEALD